MLRAAVLLIGFTAVIAQIVLMRELMVVSNGNEISLGLMLANWLLWTALGSGVVGRFAVRVRRPRALMAAVECLLAAAFPLAIFAVRGAKGALGSLPGEILGPALMFLISFTTLSFFCFLSGGLFPAAARLLDPGEVYLLEALGSGVGGLLAAWVLIRYLTPFQIAALLAVLNLLAAAGLARRVAMLALLVFPLALPRLESVSLDRLWRGFDLAAVRNSVYGNLAVVRTEESASLYENGLVLFNAPDPAAAEEAVHYALLEHPSPRSLLLIGGGLNGSIVEALRHPSLQSVDYVELDPAIFEVARAYFPREWAALQSERRVHVHNADGRLFLKTAARRFDVIIVNLPEPETAQLNRFYTLEFFREAAAKLTAGGVLSLQLRASENYISPALADFLRCIYRTLREVFPEVVAMPGETVHFFAATAPGALVSDPNELLARLRARRLRTRYVREYYLPFRMAPDRMRDLETQIRPVAGTPLNRDFTPVAYYFDVVLWSTRFPRRYDDLPRAMAVLAAVILAALALRAWKADRIRARAGLCVTAMGFTLIGLEMLLLLGFQAIYGYVYHQLAIVIAAFMTGIALGSWQAVRRPPRRPMGALAATQIVGALAPLALCLIFNALAPSTFASQVLFPVMALASGAIGGYQFPVAAGLFGSPGTLYALDLAGSCAGAILFSVWLVPLFGFLKTALLMAAVNLAPAALAVDGARRTPAR